MFRNFIFFLSLVFAVACQTVKENSSEVYKINNEIVVNHEIEQEIQPYRNQIQDSMNSVLSIAEVDFISGKPNGNLNNLIADIIFHQGFTRVRLHSISTNNTMCLLNWGGLRAPISKGKITVGTCFEVMPFENEIVIVKMTYADLQKMGAYLIQTGGHPVANFTMTSLEDMKIAGTVLSNQEYYIITSDYLYDGGDDMTFFKGKEIIRTGYKIRDALIRYFQLQEKIEDRNEKRLFFE